MKKMLVATSTILTLAASASMAMAATNGNSNTSQGQIEYVKQTTYNTDGSIVSTMQTWKDPAGGNQKTIAQYGNLHAISYLLNGGAKYLKLNADSQGNVTGGIEVSGKVPSLGSWNTQDLFVSEKESYHGKGWTHEGVVKSTDGSSLIKLTRIDQPAPPDNVEFREIVYLNPQSGLPVKGEIDKQVNGQMQLLYTETFQEKMVPNDSSLFDISGLNLTNVQQIVRG